MTNGIHVSPVARDELREHDTSHEGKCWCKPMTLEVEGGVIWVHNDLPAPKRPALIAKAG